MKEKSFQTKRKIREGVVVSNKMQNTVTVQVTRTMQHPIFDKIVTRAKKYYAHADAKVEVGQRVRIVETRPLSKLKRWRVLEVLSS